MPEPTPDNVPVPAGQGAAGRAGWWARVRRPRPTDPHADPASDERATVVIPVDGHPGAAEREAPSDAAMPAPTPDNGPVPADQGAAGRAGWWARVRRPRPTDPHADPASDEQATVVIPVDRHPDAAEHETVVIPLPEPAPTVQPEEAADPAPAAAPHPAGGASAADEAAEPARRGALERERRRLVDDREELVYHLGGLAYELHRHDLLAERVLRLRADDVAGLDARVRDIDHVLDVLDRERRAARRPPQPVGDCPECGTPFMAEARYCWSCGTRVGATDAETEEGAASADEAPGASTGEAGG